MPSSVDLSLPVDIAPPLTAMPLTLLARRDARALLLTAAVLSLALVAVPNLWMPLTAALLLLVFQWRNIENVLHRLWPVNVFMIFLWVSLPFTVTGESVHGFGLDWSLAGVWLAALSTCKANAIALLFILLLAPLGIHGAAQTLARLKVSPKLALLFLLTAHTVYRLRDHFTTALRAMHLRMSPRATLWQRWTAVTAVMARAFVQSALRAEAVQKAMLCRGMQNMLPCLELKRWRWGDSVLVLAAMLFAAAMVVFG